MISLLTSFGERAMAFANPSSKLIVLAALAVLPSSGSASAPTPADLGRALALAERGGQDAETKLEETFPFLSLDTAGAPLPFAFWGADAYETGEAPPGSLLDNAVNPWFAVDKDGDPTNGDPSPRTLRIGGAAR